MDYIAFIAGLPDIVWDDWKLSMNVAEFRTQLEDYMKGKDKELIDLFFLPNDNAQVLRLLKKQESDASLNTVYPEKVLEEEVLEPDKRIPAYLQMFISDYKEERLKYDAVPENVLSWMYYDYLMQSKNKLVREFAEYSMNLKNLVAALNARKYGMNITKEVIGDNEFSLSLRASNAKDFGLSLNYPYVEKVLALMESDDLVAREKGLDFLMWDF